MFKTIRSQLLSILILFACVSIITSMIIFSYFIKSKESVSAITQRIESTYIMLLEDIKVTHDFFENETINPKFFETGKSLMLNRHNTICHKIELSLAKLNASQQKNGFELNNVILRLKKDFMKYKILTNEMVKQILLRGFKDYGIEGDMRTYAHALEDYKKEIGLVNILQLRRHEKDYIIRQEEQYISKHSTLVEDIKKKLQARKGSKYSQNNDAIRVLDNYSALFNRLIVYEKAIGLKSGMGIKREIDIAVSKIENTFASMISIASLKEKKALAKLEFVFALIWIILIALSIVAAMLISKRVSRSLIILKEKISEFVKSDFTIRTILPIKDSENEVDILSANFSVMEEQIVSQLSALKQTNKELEMLFYRASHDIKGPLSTVKGFTNLALDRVSDPEALEYFSMIDRSWQKLSYIVDELGMVTDIKGGVTLVNEVNLEELVRSVFKEFRFMENCNNILFSVNINLTEAFHSDKKLMKIILSQLVENSIKYSNPKIPNPFVKVNISSEKSNIVRILISDNGIGIKKDFQDKIFDMFFRGTKESQGTGLGLFIVQNCLQKLNGAISVESEVDIGTNFTILLPSQTGDQSVTKRILRKREMVAIDDKFMLNYI